MSDLTPEDREAVRCSCWQLDGAWHHERFCPVPAVERIVAARVTEAVAARDAEWVRRVEALADDLWRVAPCGCGHRADLHTMGGPAVDAPSVCLGGLGVCGCDWSFVRIMQQRLRALVSSDAPQPEDEAEGGDER